MVCSQKQTNMHVDQNVFLKREDFDAATARERWRTPLTGTLCFSLTVAMYLGIKKGKVKTGSPAPSGSPGV